MSVSVDVKVDVLNSSTKAYLNRVVQRQGHLEDVRDKAVTKQAVNKRAETARRQADGSPATERQASSPTTKSLADKRIEQKPAARTIDKEIRFSHGYLTQSPSDDIYTYRLWNSDGNVFQRIAFFQPPGAPSSALSSPVGPPFWTSDKFNSTVPAYTPEYIQVESSSKSESVVATAVVPVGRDASMFVLQKEVNEASNVITYRSKRTVIGTEEVPYEYSVTPSYRAYISLQDAERYGGLGATVRENNYACYIGFTSGGLEEGYYKECIAPSELVNGYYTRTFFFYSWEFVSSTGPLFDSRYITEAYLFSRGGIKKIASPPDLSNAFAFLDDVPLLERSQGIGVDYNESQAIVTGSPRTLEALTRSNPASWSRYWLQLRKEISGSDTRKGFLISGLDPDTKQPVNLGAGRPVRNIAMPFNAPQAILDSLYQEEPYYTVLATWDWGRPGLCRQQLIDLGFSAEDLAL